MTVYLEGDRVGGEVGYELIWGLGMGWVRVMEPEVVMVVVVGCGVGMGWGIVVGRDR